MDKRIKAAQQAFKNHVAEFNEITINGNTMWVLNWKAPDTRAMAVRYIFSNGVLQVTGDLGEAMYKWGNHVRLESLAGWNDCYILGKLIASSCKKYEYDSGQAEKDLTQIFKNNGWFKWHGLSRADAKELLDEVVSIFCDYDDPEIAYQIAIAKTDLENIPDIHECGMYDAGKKIHYWILCQLVGLRMAYAQLIERNIYWTQK